MVKGLEGYIKKVVSEACQALERPADTTQWHYQIIGDDLLFTITCPYEKVTRRVAYRLWKNMERNFGLQFHFVNQNAMKTCYEAWKASAYQLLEEVDPNYSIAKWDGPAKKEYTIQAFRKTSPMGDYLERLKAAGYDCTDSSASWGTFETAYKAVYGKTPLESYLEEIERRRKNGY